VVNDVSGGQVFNQADNEVVILGSDGSASPVPHGPKVAIAQAIWDAVVPLLELHSGI